MSVKSRRLLTVLAVLTLLAPFAYGLQWSDLAPRLRRSSSMITDTLNHRVILFGGTNDRLSSEWFNDVWAMPLLGPQPLSYAWHQLHPTGTPPAGRAMAASAYDPVHQRMIVYGGQASPSAQYGDIWSLSLVPGAEAWQQLAPSGTLPPARLGAFAVYCPERNAFVMFGGLGADWYNDLWLLDLDNMVWHQLNPSGSVPGQRFDAASFFQASTGRMLIFGGRGIGVSYNDLWVLDLTPGSEHWTQLTAGGSVPSGRYEFAYGYDPVGERLFIFSGWDPDNSWYDDSYELDLAGPTWTLLSPTGDIPIERRNSTGAYDPYGGNFIVFGGDLGSDYYLGGTSFLNVGVGHTYEWDTRLPVSAPTLTLNSLSSGVVRINFTAPLGGPAEVSVLDVTGRVVKELFRGTAHSSEAELSWDRRDDLGRPVGAGSYFCRLTSGETEVTRKFALLR